MSAKRGDQEGSTLPNAVPDKMSSSTEPSVAFIGVCGVLGTDRVEPVKRLKKPDFVGLGAARDALMPASERMLGARELGADAAGVA